MELDNGEEELEEDVWMEPNVRDEHIDTVPNDGDDDFHEPDPNSGDELDFEPEPFEPGDKSDGDPEHGVDLDADADLDVDVDNNLSEELESQQEEELDVNQNPVPGEIINVEIAVRRSPRLASLPRVDYKQTANRCRVLLRRSPQLARLPRVNYKE